MSVMAQYYFSCGGCDAKAEGAKQMVNREFVSVSGRSYGVGGYHIEYPEIDPPDGWVAHDPYTSCCYCPECWARITEEKP